MSDTLPPKSDSLSMETPSMEIPSMEVPSIINIPHIDPLPERTEEEKAEAHRMFHELLTLKTQSDPLLQHIAQLTNQVNELTKKII